MEFHCENSSNPDIRTRSLELLSQVQLGCWVFLLVSLLGAINNCILLTLSYQLGWFRAPHYVLINVQVFADLMFDCTAIAINTYAIAYHNSNTPTTIDQLHCVAIFVPTAIFSAWSQRLSLAIAIDRLINVLFPYKWVALGMTYRLIMIAVGLLWGLVQETTWLAFANKELCVAMCFDYVSYPNAWWENFVTVGDMITCGLIVIAYIALPPLSEGIFRRLNCQQYFFVALVDMEQRQQNMVKRVRRMSVLVVTSFLCTTFVGTVAFDFTSMSSNDAKLLDLLVFIQPFAGALQSLNTVLPLFLFAWKEESVRNELRAIVRGSNK